MGLLGDIVGAVSGQSWLGPAINAVSGFIGQQNTNDANALAAQQTSAFNAAEAEKNRQFQQRSADENKTFQQSMWQSSANWENEMSSSAYQRAVTDMKLAGLNPMLAYSQGGASSPGVSTPSGSTAGGSQASGVTPTYINPVLAGAQAASMGASSALTTAQTVTEGERPALVKNQAAYEKEKATQESWTTANFERLLYQRIRQGDESITLTESEAGKAVAIIRNLAKEGALLDARTAGQRIENELLANDVPKAKALAGYWSSEWGKASPYASDVKGAFDSAVGGLRSGAAASSAASYGQDVRNRGFYYGNH